MTISDIFTIRSGSRCYQVESRTLNYTRDMEEVGIELVLTIQELVETGYSDAIFVLLHLLKDDQDFDVSILINNQSMVT